MPRPPAVAGLTARTLPNNPASSRSTQPVPAGAGTSAPPHRTPGPARLYPLAHDEPKEEGHASTNYPTDLPPTRYPASQCAATAQPGPTFTSPRPLHREAAAWWTHTPSAACPASGPWSPWLAVQPSSGCRTTALQSVDGACPPDTWRATPEHSPHTECTQDHPRHSPPCTSRTCAVAYTIYHPLHHPA